MRDLYKSSLLISVAILPCIIVGVVTNVSLNRQRHSMRELQRENEALAQQVTSMKFEMDGLGNMALAYAETPTGLKLVPAEFGASRQDLDFLKRFRGPLLSLTTDFNALTPGQLSRQLHDTLNEAFNADSKNLELGDTPRSALIAFSVLRVNGSMPTYEVRAAVPDDLRSMVDGTSGNCSDFSYRLAMVAEALGLKAAIISANTPSLPGHVFVDAYDPQEDVAYLLDANFNVVLKRKNAHGLGFLEYLLSKDQKTQGDFAATETINAMPVYFRFVDPGESGIYNTPLSASYINGIRGDRVPTWRKWTANDLDDLVAWWIKAPNHKPKTLAESSKWLTKIPVEFNRSGDYAARIRTASGIADAEVAAKF